MQMLSRLALSLVLCVATVLSPYAQVQRAYAVAPAIPVAYYIGAALATAGGIFGYSVATGALNDGHSADLDVDFETIGKNAETVLSGLSPELLCAKAISLGAEINDKTAWADSARSTLISWAESAGKAGSIALDDFAAAGDSAMKLVSALSALLVAESSSVPDSGSFSAFGNTYLFTSPTMDAPDSCSLFIGSKVSDSGVITEFWAKSPLSASDFSVSYNRSFGCLQVTSLVGSTYFLTRTSKGGSGSSSGFEIYDSNLSGSYLSSALCSLIDGVSLPENKDVINPRLEDAATLPTVDMLNPADSQVLGSDAVFDGDTITSRGSVPVLGQDVFTSNPTWQQLLDLLKAHLLDGVNAKTDVGDISLDVPTTGVVDGELVTDVTLEDVLKNPNSSFQNKPDRFNKSRNWKNLGGKFQQIFPFCLYFDMVKLVYLLDAEPVAPEFDWVVPSIWGDGEPYKIHFSLKAWDDAASVLRMLLLFSFAIGFVFLLLRFVNPGRDNSSDGKSGGGS